MAVFLRCTGKGAFSILFTFLFILFSNFTPAAHAQEVRGEWATRDGALLRTNEPDAQLAGDINKYSVKKENSKIPLLAMDGSGSALGLGTRHDPANSQDILTVKYSLREEPCDVPVNVQLYLHPFAIRAGWQVRTTADFGDHILKEDTGVRWTWGDGTDPSISYTAFGTSRITGKHTYSEAGIYRVGLDFSESCLQPANDDYEQWQVIYDPNAGAVTGAGLFISPPGAGVLMGQAGLVQFAFNARYSGSNATTPQGLLLMRFGTGFIFQSNSLDWLVVSGNRAVWKGTGTIHGQGRFGFVVSVQDAGGRSLNDPQDQIRIRIWDMYRGNAIVYDNFAQAGDIYNMAGFRPAIGQGNIVIHEWRRIAIPVLVPGLESGVSAAADLKEQLQVYPNPAQSHATISFVMEQDSDYILRLYDMRGALVQELKQGHAQAKTKTEVQIDVAQLAKGIYVAQLASADGVRSVKLVLDK